MIPRQALQRLRAALFSTVLLATFTSGGLVQSADPPSADKSRAADAKAEPQPLNKEGTVLLDKAGGRLLLKTRVALREGVLEMLCCLKQTKEHESILSLDAKAYVVHTGLLALGAKPGAPVNFVPVFQPPTGQKIDIFVSWTDEKGRAQRVPAHSWIRNSTHRFWSETLAQLPDGLDLPANTELRYDAKLKELSWYGPMTERERDRFLALSKNEAFRAAIGRFYQAGQSREMQADWVFAGSGFATDPGTGRKVYMAEEGDLICVANFTSAMIDVSANSSNADDTRLFEAFTERIPPRDTPVTIELIPIFEKAAPADKAGGKAAGSKPAAK